MKRRILHLIIYTLICGGWCSCERLEIPEVKEEVSDDEPTTPLPGIGSNDNARNGSRKAPYTVAHAQAIGDDYLKVYDAWVEGYIVGWINGSSYPSGARFGVEGAGYTNLLLADSVFENAPEHCIPIELPYNSVIRQELNLADNPSNLRRHIKLKGDIMPYFATTGLKSISDYEWMGESAMEDEKEALSVVELNEDFSHFAIGDSLNLKNWTFIASHFDYWQISGNTFERFATICHTDTFSNHTFEYWLYTPPLNLNRMKKAVFSFKSAYENWDGRSRLDVFILPDRKPHEIGILPYLNATIAQPETSDEGEWIYSGDIQLDSYSGIQYIAFRYKGTCSGKNATKFNLDDIRLKETEE